MILILRLPFHPILFRNPREWVASNVRANGADDENSEIYTGSVNGVV